MVSWVVEGILTVSQGASPFELAEQSDRIKSSPSALLGAVYQCRVPIPLSDTANCEVEKLPFRSI